jgi:hypothetical protein
MAQAIPIKLHVSNALRLMGQLYRSPADALKEYVSNAVDRWHELRAMNRGPAVCEVEVDVRKASVSVLCNTPGMSELEFRTALGRVADSQKKGAEIAQIGRLGIGLWGFLQVGTACTLYSRDANDTLRVRLREGQDHGEIDRAPRHESLDGPGFRVMISGLRFDPTRSRSPLAPDKLQKLIAEKFEKFLRDGALVITLRYPKMAPVVVRAPEIALPRIGANYRDWWLPGKRPREIHVDLWFDPSGRGKVGIRHAGVVVVESLAEVGAYGLETSIFGSGSVTGTVDADFLTPLPARTMFEENDDWFDLMTELDRLRPSVEAEVDELRREDLDRRCTAVHQSALQIARDILDLPDFRDLALPGGMAKRGARNPTDAHADSNDLEEADASKPREEGPAGDPPRGCGEVPDAGGSRINVVEIPFSDGKRTHSRFVGGVVQVNTLNPHYAREMTGAEENRITYVTQLIGKEVLAYNGGEDLADALDRYLSFLFEMKGQATSAKKAGTRGRSRRAPKPRKG